MIPHLRITFTLLRAALICGAVAGSLSAQTPELRELKNSGNRANTINMVFLGDGYVAGDKETFFEHARVRMNTILDDDAMSPFASITNVFAIFVASNESGTTIPAENITRDTYYKASYLDRPNARLVYVADSTGQARINTVLSDNVPEYDYVALLVNSTRYGGAGGFPMVATIDEDSLEVLLHESGHSFAGLTDEYIDEAIADQYPRTEYANSTIKTDRNEIVWRQFIEDSTPIPTTEVPSDPLQVGLWEGGNYRTNGHYRPIYNSKMRSLDQPWGAINLRAFAQAVHDLDINGASALPSISQQPNASTYTTGGALSLSVTPTGTGPFTYQWIKDGKFLRGETHPTLTRTTTSTGDYGLYTVEITNARGALNSSTVTISASSTGGGGGNGGGDGSGGLSGRLVNLSVRSSAGSGSETLTVGFVVGEGTTGSTKSLLVRAIGPTLGNFGVANALPDPALILAPLNQASIAQNDNWGGDQNLVNLSSSVGAFALEDGASLDAALAQSIGNGPFTAQVAGASTSPGIALVEVYDADGVSAPRLVNISARSRVGTGADVLIAGFVLQGPGSTRLLIRAVGPTLGDFGVNGVLPDPTLTIRQLNTSGVLGANDNWAGDAALKSAFTTSGAFALPNDNSLDAALIVELPPGAYTATVADSADREGVALVEVYELP
jgi:hypothetical protein